MKNEPLDALVDGCAEASRSGTRSDTGYCFELFRRAIDERDDAAWVAISRQYESLICDWLLRAAHRSLTTDEIHSLYNDTLANFWRSLTTRDVRIEERFEHLGKILSYLRQCAVSALLNDRRQRKRHRRLKQKLYRRPDQPYGRAMEEHVAERFESAYRLSHVRTWMETYVTDEQELLLLELSFEEALSPQEIAARYPDDFADAVEVRRIKDRVLRRARRHLGNL